MERETVNLIGAIVFLYGLLWLFVPFAVFGIKPLLTKIEKHLKTIEEQNGALMAATGVRVAEIPTAAAGGVVSDGNRLAN